MANLNVQRMAINRGAVTEFALRPPPRVPPEVIQRFPAMDAYDLAWQRWAQDTQNLIQGLLTLKVEAE